jgi:ribosomal protein L7/L12
MDKYITLLIIIVIALGLALFRYINKRLQRMETKLTAILHHLGVEQDILPEPSEKVQDLAKVPNSKIDAVRIYRKQTGAGLKEAVKVVEKLSLQERSEI